MAFLYKEAIFANNLGEYPMKIERSKVISFAITVAIFGVASVYLLGVPKEFPSFDFVKEIFAKKEDKPLKKKSPPKVKSKGKVGRAIDAFNGVNVYYNGRVSNIQGRNVTADGYNLGLKYQCVEFVKRYYYEFYNHKMPDSYGNAKDFFSPAIEDGQINPARNLRQFSNPSKSRPKVGDLLIFGPTPYNKFGHVAIISKVERQRLQIIQQNPGSNNPSRQWFPLEKKGTRHFINHQYVSGWLRRS
ncbi:MAG: CHAP domain-containing protein [Saprospiraceae bacterium]|nr:CHAP domain-containing protein [Saprospiraceae bacterium]